jgi:flagellar hook assembly protein FlgD
MKKSMEPFERKSVFDRGQMLTEKEQRIKVYPNPVNSKANIQFELDEDCHVSLKVYNVMGEAVSVLADEDLTAGYHNFIWDRKGLTGHRVSEGMYFVRFETQGTVETKRILVIE